MMSLFSGFLLSVSAGAGKIVGIIYNVFYGRENPSVGFEGTGG